MAKEWYSTSNHLCFLSVPDEPSLAALLKKALAKGYQVASFREPDRENELTAIALEPRAKKMCQGISLALC